MRYVIRHYYISPSGGTVDLSPRQAEPDGRKTNWLWLEARVIAAHIETQTGKLTKVTREPYGYLVRGESDAVELRTGKLSPRARSLCCGARMWIPLPVRRNPSAPWRCSACGHRHPEPGGSPVPHTRELPWRTWPGEFRGRRAAIRAGAADTAQARTEPQDG